MHMWKSEMRMWQSDKKMLAFEYEFNFKHFIFIISWSPSYFIQASLHALFQKLEVKAHNLPLPNK